MARLAARAGMKVQVLEKEARPGGCVHTERYPNGFWLELGAHTCYQTYARWLGLFDAPELSPIARRQKLNFQLYASGRLSSVPSQLNIPRALGALFLLPTLRKQGKTVEGYYGPLIGQRNYRAVFRHLFAAVACQPADEFPAELLFKKRPERRKEFPKSFTHAKGLSGFIDALASTDGVTIATGEEASSIEPAPSSGITVFTQSGHRYFARALALAVDPQRAAQLTAPFWPALSERLSHMRMSALHTLGVTVATQALRLPPLMGMAGADAPFYSAVSRDVVPHSDWRGFAFHFRPGVDSEMQLSSAASALGVSPSEFLATHRRSVALPTLSVGHAQWAKETDALLASRSLFLLGNYWQGLSLEDCAVRAHSEFQRWQRLKLGDFRQ